MGDKATSCCVLIQHETINSLKSQYLQDLTLLCFHSDYRHAKPFTPVNPNTVSPGERGNSGPPTTTIWSIPHESSGYPDKLSVGLGDFTQQPQILRETRSSGSSKISAPREECPLCRKVCHHSSTIGPQYKHDFTQKRYYRAK